MIGVRGAHGVPFVRCAAAVLAAASIVACGAGTPRYRGGVDHEPVIRVLLDQTAGVLRVHASGRWRIVAGTNTLLRGTEPVAVQLRRRGGAIDIDAGQAGTASADGLLDIIVDGSGTLKTKASTWPGRIRVLAYGHSDLLMLNVVGIESYLEGVVPHEIGRPGPDAYAAVEAQAIAARTYALGRIQTRSAEAFDVYAGIRDQVYRGTVGRTRVGNAAVRDTRGMVVRYRGKLARCYYSATCGGHTANIERVWPQRESAPYLQGVLDRDDRGTSFCAWVHNFRWHYAFTGRKLGRILRRTISSELGAPRGGVGRLVDIEVTQRTRSGRAEVLRVKTARGEWEVVGDRIRRVLSPDPARGRILPSTLFYFKVRRRGGRVVRVDIMGGGNGHGVGMCQNGAISMARRGYSYRMIVAHYYPGTTIERAYGRQS